MGSADKKDPLYLLPFLKLKIPNTECDMLKLLKVTGDCSGSVVKGVMPVNLQIDRSAV